MKSVVIISADSITIDQVLISFYVSGISEKKWQYNGSVHHLFIDFKKVYDSLRRKVVYNNLNEFRTHKKFACIRYIVQFV